MKILLLIPAYNCAPQIGRVINQIDQESSLLFEKVIIIENRSLDSTLERAIDALKQNKHINGIVSVNKKNIGLGGSYKTGFKFAIKNNFDFVMILHGDDQGKLRDMIPLIKNESIKDFDCTMGARFHKKSILKNYSWFRTFGNKIFNIIFGLALKINIKDLGSGINIYKVKSLNENDFLKFPNDLRFDYCGMMSHSYRSKKIKFVPITWSDDDQISNVKIFRQAFSTLGLLLNYLINKNKFMKKDKSGLLGLKYETNIVFEQKAN